MKKKTILLSAAAVVLSLSISLLLTGAAANNGRGSALAVRVISLEGQSFTEMVSVTGTVHSAQSTEIHSALNFPMESVNVQVGDRVEMGDVLAVLDMSALEMSANQLEASLRSAQAAANQNLAATRSELETARRNIQTGSDPRIIEAHYGFSSATLAVQAAEIEIQSAEFAAIAARNNLSLAQRDLREYRRYHYPDRDYNDRDDPELNRLRDNVRLMQTLQNIAMNNIELAMSSLEMAENNLEAAREFYSSAQTLSADAIVSLENHVEAAQISTNFEELRISIQNLRSDLARAEITSPISGTVTAVIAEEGALGVGLLFVVQDTENLVIKTNISELDLATVSLGDEVHIRSDATGGEVFAGTLTRIAPTSIQTAHGVSNGFSVAEFECEITVNSRENGLRIGMNTRLSIVAGEREEVFKVPFQAIETISMGEGSVLIAMAQPDGSYMVERVLVDIGAESSRGVEISAPELYEGVLIITNMAGVQEGMDVTPQIR